MSIVERRRDVAETKEKAKTGTSFGRVAWLFAFGLVLTQAALLAWNLQGEYRRALETEYARLADAARIADENISGSLRAIDLLLRDVSDELERRGPVANVTDYMATRARAFPEVRVVMASSPEGIIKVTTRPEFRDWDVRDRPYYTQTRDAADRDRTVYTLLACLPPSNAYVVFATRALPQHNGQWAGVVTATLDLNIFHTLLASIRPGDASSMIALDSLDGRIISRAPNPEPAIGFNVAKGGAFEQHLATGQKLSFHRLSGLTDHIEKIFAVRNVADGSFVLTVSKPVSEAMAPWQAQAINQGIAFFALSIAVLSLTWLAIRHHSREAHARALAETAQEDLRGANEELIAARDKADAANQAKSDFLAMMSHEIRTPITGVLGMADLLRRTSLDQEQAGYVNTLAAATKTLLTILNDILDISKIEAGKVVFEEAEFALHDAVVDTLAMFRGSPASKGLELVHHFAEDLPCRVVGDPARFKQLLFNLTGNAIKFTEHGSVHLRLSVKEHNENSSVVMVEVEDTGIGIAPDQLPLLFKPFSQLEPSTSRRFGGTGLGLVITKRLVEMMGGAIGVDSRPGNGTRFWFTLPFRVAPPRPIIVPMPGEMAATPVVVRSLRILLAEDNSINQKLVRTMLQKVGHTVEVADNGRIAVETLAAGDFDAVLMAMQMPEMDGDEATRAIRALPPPKNRLPIIALTANALLEQRNRYLAAGVDDLVAKPIDWDALLATLNTHTQGDASEHFPDFTAHFPTIATPSDPVSNTGRSTGTP
ncbi:MAG: response regulator [Alphaproteobacteria bacterium]|nr:response regulator [Alphaproteobacteria bacterium]